MKTTFLKSFEQDLKKLKKDQQMLRRIRNAIVDLEAAGDLHEISSLKKLNAAAGDYYRLRVGDFRIGFMMEDGVAIFVRCLHRRDIYRYFP